MEDNPDLLGGAYELIESEPSFGEYRAHYGDLADLGIAKGRPFEPDERMRDIFTRAAVMGHAQLCVQLFADRRRPDRAARERHLRHTDYVYARQKWFYQAQIESPAMFARTPGAGSLYWLCTRDVKGGYLDGRNSCALDVPQPVPAKLFWSLTVYDARTRSEICTDQNKAALRSLFELDGVSTDEPARVYLGSEPPSEQGAADRWIQALPDVGWFVYFRICGPEAPAFDQTWQLPDFTTTT